MTLPPPRCPACGHETSWPRCKEIAFYYGPSPRNDGAPGFTLQAMRRLAGINAHHFECRGDPKLHGKADLRVCIDWAEDTTEYADFLPEHPRAYWISDTHVTPEGRIYRLKKATTMDKVWYSIRSDQADVQSAVNHGQSHYWLSAEWLPYAAEPTLWQPAERMEKRWDLGWIGHAQNYPSRVEFISQILDEFGERFHFTVERKFFEAAVSWLQPCWFVVNHCMTDSTNLRTFEGMALGAVVLQPETSDLAELGFTDGVHLVTYKDVDDAIEKVRHYLCRPADMERIGRCAREEILLRHTWVHRAARIAEYAGWVAPQGALERAVATPPWELLETKTWEGNV